ncbi:hypothetical protein J4557_07115 [Actinomadura nitritigenes]|uniref:Restriction endonuclease n=2 Tax=Actinomadura nitritigenes TaxID=134602 RepID=A0ABS3QTU3_9ACTN|nr:hypothetical protein [Actinomadura nitritigenes]MBO2437286.1 hypothetical protein [Actinomadura nitritigenes]
MTPMELWSSVAPWAAELRRDLSERWDTLLLLYSTGLIGGFHTSFTAATAFFRVKAAHRPPLKVFQVPRREDESAVVKDFEKLLAREGGRTRYGYVIREMPQWEEGFDFDRYDPVVLKQRADLAGFGSVSTMGDLFDVVARIHTAGHSKLISTDAEPGAVRLVGGRDVQRDGTIAPPSDVAYWVRAQPEHLLAPGDLILREIYAPGDPHGFCLAEVTEQDLPAAASHTTIVLRPKADLESQRIGFAMMWLRTPLARTLAGTSGVHVSVKNLLTLPVPQPDEALEKAFDELDAVRLRLEEWQLEADSLLGSVFMHQTPAQARLEIIDKGRALRLRVEAASLLDDLGHTIRTRFPYPIASRWRETEAQLSAGDPRAAYSAVLDTAEILLCYVAQVALALGREEDLNFGAVVAIKGKLTSGRSGPGFGDWVAVLDESATSRRLRNLPTEHPLQDIRALFAGSEATNARQRLYGRRNDEAHLRRIDSIDLPGAIQAAFADLTILTDRARFLADLPLLHLTDVRWDTLERTALVHFRELMGDHPVVPTKTMAVPRNDLEKGSLYMRDSGHQLHLLRPFLVGQVCPVCRTWSTFHVDRVPGEAVLLKSLEHGHIFRDHSPAMSAALSGVGLL